MFNEFDADDVLISLHEVAETFDQNAVPSEMKAAVAALIKMVEDYSEQTPQTKPSKKRA
jgi:hypothetical protein